MSNLPTEAIILTSGLPGAGKTLYAVHLAKQFAAEGTRVFSWGLDGANEELFEVLPPEWSFSDWQQLPAGSVVIFDEAHKLLPTRTAGAPPKSIQDLTEIRHFGLRFIFITQDPRNLDVFVRRLIGRHYHLKRKMGFPGAIVKNFDHCADDPMDYHESKNATSELWKYPKDLFELYKSASLHVVKPKIPKKVMIFGTIAVVGIIFVIYTLFSYSMKIKNGDIIPGVEVANEITSEAAAGHSSGQGITPTYTTIEEYVELTTPLSPVAPWTAPIYEGVRTVQRIPDKPVCYIVHHTKTRSECKCFTDQLTKIDIPDVVCRSVVKDGIYSPYHSPYADNQAREGFGGGAQGGRQAVQPAPPAE